MAFTNNVFRTFLKILKKEILKPLINPINQKEKIWYTYCYKYLESLKQ